MNYWLIKSEPHVFSFDDLLAAPDQTSPWEGIRNYQARNFMRDSMKKGDKLLYYHSSTQVPGIAGIAEVASKAYPDPTQFNEQSPYFDPKASQHNVRWVLVDIKALRKLERYLPLAELKKQSTLADMRLLQKGNRLSIMPVTKPEYDFIVKLAKKPASS